MRPSLLLLLAAVAGCSAEAIDAPLVEYPTAPEDGTSPGDRTKPGTPDPASTSKPSPPAPEPTPQPGMTKLWDAVTWMRGVTSDGAVVLQKDGDLVVLPPGATQATTLVTDWTSDDEDLVRGRLVSMWTSADVLPSSITTWSVATGLVKDGPVAYRGLVTPKPSSDTFAYRGKAASSLASKLAVTRPGQGDGATIVASLDNGVVDKACAPGVAWVGDDLLVAGCVNGATVPSVAVYAADGSGKRATVLDGAAPGIWPNRARTRAVVQTTSASSIRGFTPSSSPLALDTRLVRAVFSADDAKVLYLRADGKLRRAATSAPITPLDLGTAIALLGASDDARYAAFATTKDASSDRTDLWVVDAQAPGAPRKLADAKAVLHGFSRSGDAVVYQTTPGIALAGPLFVASAAGGAPVKVSDEAQRVVFDGDVVYFHELTSSVPKTMTLKAVRLASPATSIVVADNLDPLTTQAMLAQGRLFVASKLGMWSYPVVTP